MKNRLLLVIGLALPVVTLSSQAKPVLVVNPFTSGTEVVWPYDMKVMQAQTVAEFKVMLGKDFDIVAEAPTTPPGSVYTLDVAITGWRQGNAAKRLFVGMGSGREAADIHYRITDGAGKKVLEQKDTVRTNFYSQAAGSVGTLAHPLSQKMADRIQQTKLK